MQEKGLVIAFIGMVVFTAVVNAIAFALGFFTYGGIGGGLAILLLCVIYGSLTVLAVIPLIGFVAQIYVLLSIAWPVVSQFTGIEASWLTTLIFAVYVLSGFILTANTTLLAVSSN